MLDQRTGLRDRLLVALTFAVGAIDALSVMALGKVFSAFMTGNLVLLGLGTAGGDGPPTVRLLIALGAFGAGAYLAARIVRPAEPGRMWPPSTTVSLIGTVLLEFVLWVMWVVVDGRPSPASAAVLVGGYALAMGAQTTAVFSLGVRAVFSTAATATWTVLVADTAHWRDSREEIGRLLAVVLAVFAGAVAGGLLVLHVRSFAPLLPVLVTSGVVWVAARQLHGRPAAAARHERRDDLRSTAVSG